MLTGQLSRRQCLANAVRCIQSYSESIVWTAALVLLYFQPASDGGRSFCFFKWLGFHRCIGCGIGHSIRYALHLEFQKSLQAHLMGIPAVFILGARIISDLFHKQTAFFTPSK